MRIVVLLTLGLLSLIYTNSAVGVTLRYALIIGSNVGLDNGGKQPYAPLRHAEREAKKVKEKLVETANFDGSSKRTKLLVGGTIAEVRAAFDALASQLREDRKMFNTMESIFLLYYTGHGLNGSLLLGDGPLSSHSIFTLFKNVGADLSVGIFDACNGGSLDAVLSEKGIKATPGLNLAKHLPRDVLSAKGTIWYVSSGADQSSYEDENLGGVFTHYFIESLEKAKKDGPAITLDAIWRYVRKKTISYTSRYHRAQIPEQLISKLRSKAPVYFSFPISRESKLVLSEALEGTFALAYNDGNFVEIVEKKTGKKSELDVFSGNATLIRLDGQTGGSITHSLVLTKGETLVLKTIPESRETSAKKNLSKTLFKKGGVVGIKVAPNLSEKNRSRTGDIDLIASVKPSKDGSIVVVATTDMLVPTDINWLSWKVKRIADKKTLKNERVQLYNGKQFPVSLVDGIQLREMTGPLEIQVEAKRDDPRGEVVVQNRFRFKLSDSGSENLTIPLDWLCSIGAQPINCESGKTCLSGECVDATAVASLFASQNVNDVSQCFDMTGCYDAGVIDRVPHIDSTTGNCVLSQSEVLRKYNDMNLALIVNTSVVGNFGVCSPEGKWGRCYIPLDSHSQRGWQLIKENQRVSGILLPRAVCENSSDDRILGIAISSKIAGCSQKSVTMSLCQSKENCIRANGVCPSVFDEKKGIYRGYSCSGKASPFVIDTDIADCWIPADDTGKKTTGRWCCTTGEMPSTDPLMIDDMSGGPQVKIDPPYGHIGGFWWTAADSSVPNYYPLPAPNLFMYKGLPSPITTNDGRQFDRAACFRSPGILGSIALMGFNFIVTGETSGHAYYDASQYSGIRFWAYSPVKNQTIKVGFPDKNTLTEDAQSTCNRNPKGGSCGDDWAVQDLRLSSTWKEYVVKWTDLRQEYNDSEHANFDSFDATHVSSAYFAVVNRNGFTPSPPFDFCISQIKFTQ